MPKKTNKKSIQRANQNTPQSTNNTYQSINEFPDSNILNNQLKCSYCGLIIDNIILKHYVYDCNNVCDICYNNIIFMNNLYNKPLPPTPLTTLTTQSPFTTLTTQTPFTTLTTQSPFTTPFTTLTTQSPFTTQQPPFTALPTSNISNILFTTTSIKSNPINKFPTIINNNISNEPKLEVDVNNPHKLKFILFNTSQNNTSAHANKKQKHNNVKSTPIITICTNTTNTSNDTINTSNDTINNSNDTTNISNDTTNTGNDTTNTSNDTTYTGNDTTENNNDDGDDNNDDGDDGDDNNDDGDDNNDEYVVNYDEYDGNCECCGDDDDNDSYNNNYNDDENMCSMSNNLFFNGLINSLRNIKNSKAGSKPGDNKFKNANKNSVNNDMDINFDKDLPYEWLGANINNIDDLINLGRLYDSKKRKRYNLNLKQLNMLVEPLTELKNMIGMQDVKKIIFEQLIYYLQKLDDKNVDMLHTVIVGPPGVGKTQLTHIIAKIYNRLGFLKTDKVICAKRDDLVGEYIGQTAPKTRKVLERALGGVLLLDEIYSMSPTSERDFARESIDMINMYLSEHAHDLVCVIAGYKKPTYEKFFSQNEGLARRFTHHFEIKGYSADELVLIFKKYLEEQKWILGDSIELITPLIKNNMDIFPNFGGDMTTLFACCKKTHSRRLLNIPTEDELIKAKKNITIQDIVNGIQLFKEIKEKHTSSENEDKNKYINMYS